MKYKLFFAISVCTCMAAVAQKVELKKSAGIRNCQRTVTNTKDQPVPASLSNSRSRPSGVKKIGNPNAVTVLDLGTSANLDGYAGGTRTMVWADDDLKAVVNFYRMGPGADPLSLSGYLGMDIGINMGATQADWTSQVQVYAATLPAAPDYYDACRYPSAAIYNPTGNTSLANAFLAYFAPNYANLLFSGSGGYSYGTANLVNNADTTKHLRWYAPPPYTHIPSGFTVAKNGIAHMVDLDMNTASGIPVYQDSVIYGRGVWNEATHDFEYTFRTLSFPCKGDAPASDCKIAASPNGMTVWISVLTNLPEGTPLADSAYYPVLRKSTDGGLTWSDLMPVQLDGPNGISAIKNTYSSYFIENYFVGPPFPTRDEIPYTTAFDHSISVDSWGEVHMGVAIGYAPGGYAIATGVDSLINVFDIFSCNGGPVFVGIRMGSLSTFRGTWGGYTSDNRVYTSRTKAGDRMFFTWNDTKIAGEVDNQHPDVFARGYDLIMNKITASNDYYEPVNVTAFSSISQQAYWQCASPIVFTDNDKFRIPICTQWFEDPAMDAGFKYISDFSFLPGDFSLSLGYPNSCWQWWNTEQISNEPDDMTIFPNPARESVEISLTLLHHATVNVEVANLLGTRMISCSKGFLDAGVRRFQLDVRSLPAGIYFIAVSVNDKTITKKMVIE